MHARERCVGGAGYETKIKLSVLAQLVSYTCMKIYIKSWGVASYMGARNYYSSTQNPECFFG